MSDRPRLAFPPLPEPEAIDTGQLTDLGDVTLRGDLRSYAWDGGGEVPSGGDPAATAGFLLDTSTGRIQAQELIAKGGTFSSITILLNSGTAFPSSPSDGELFYRTDLNKAYRYDGTSWHAIDALDDANRVGTAVIATAAIQNAAITNAKIANLAVTNAKINDLSAAKIDAGFLSADRIDTHALTVEKLVLGSRDNLAQDPGFESGTKNTHRYQETAGSWTVSDTGVVVRSGDFAARFTTNGGTSNDNSIFTNLANDSVSCSGGQEIYGSVWVRAQTDGSFNGGVQLRLRFFEAGVLVQDTGTTVTPTAGVYEQIEHRATAPAGADSVETRVRLTFASASAGSIDVDDFEFRRMVGTLVIEDQAVDIARMLDPVHQDGTDIHDADVTIDSTESELLSDTFTIPSWVGDLHVSGAVGLAFANADSQGVGGPMHANIEIGGTVVSGALEGFETGDNGWHPMVVPGHRNIVSPGSSVKVALRGDTTSGTSTDNEVDVVSHVTGTR